MPKLLFLSLLLLASLTGHADHLRVVAQKGDGAYSLLRTYGLLEFPCNLEEFYRLNGLKRNAGLKIGTDYKLPIEILRYNGKSIRTTTNNANYDRALDIQHSNEDLLERGLRKKDFRQDRVLYVPFHIDNCPTPPKVEQSTTVPSAKLPTPNPAPDKEIKDLGEIAQSEAANASAGPASSANSTTHAPAAAPAKPGGRPTGPAPEQVTTTDYRTFDIFGEKYAYVPKIDNALAGRIFYIVSGHGGPDPGAGARRSGHRIYEDEYAYDVALRLTRNILAHGGTPYMIVRDEDGIRDERYLKADKDETVWGGEAIPINQKQRLWQRCDIINSLYEQNLAKGLDDQTMISIHIDSRHRSQRVDLFFYHHENDMNGRAQANKMRAAVQDAYRRTRAGRGYSGTVRARDLHVLRETKPTGVFIELANMANPSDQLRIIEPKNRQLIADWLLEGLL